jgi:hypothetical protein
MIARAASRGLSLVFDVNRAAIFLKRSPRCLRFVVVEICRMSTQQPRPRLSEERDTRRVARWRHAASNPIAWVPMDYDTTRSMQYEIGRIYSRRNDIDSVFGGQPQGGISTPSLAPVISLFSGPAGGFRRAGEVAVGVPFLRVCCHSRSGPSGGLLLGIGRFGAGAPENARGLVAILTMPILPTGAAGKGGGSDRIGLAARAGGDVAGGCGREAWGRGGAVRWLYREVCQKGGRNGARSAPQDLSALVALYCASLRIQIWRNAIVVSGAFLKLL